MSKSSFSSQISKLQLEILDSSFQNRLLNFPAQNVLQSPLIKESSDLFIIRAFLHFHLLEHDARQRQAV